MNIYFVRHGQSILNATNMHQFPMTPLSATGKLQAEAVARRFHSISIEKIFSSDMLRARQTAEEIAKITKKPLILTELARERRRPSEILGRSYEEPNVKRITGLIEINLADDNWRYSDEETFPELKKRSKEFLYFLEEESKSGLKNAAVVTHGAFLKITVLTILFGDNFDSHVFQDFYHNAKTTNTGITMAEFENQQWRLLTWNDYAHLGD